MDNTQILPPCINVARVRESAPDFACEAVVSGRFEERSLQYYMSRKQWLMILFIPMAFSFVCPTEVLAFDNVLEEFTDEGCSVIFVSTDSKYSLQTWQTRPKADGGLGNIHLPLLSDQNHKFSRAYGVLVEDEGIALRGRFIINPDGIVKHISINDVAVGRSVLESLRLLQAYKAEYEHGVFCAANWRPGDATLEPTVEAAQAYINENFGELSMKDAKGVGTSGSALKKQTSNTSDTTDHHAKVLGPGHSRSHSESAPLTPRNLAMEAIHKVFGGTSPEPRTPLATVDAMNALSEGNARPGHKTTKSQGTTQSYFDYEPFPSSPKHEKKDSAHSINSMMETTGEARNH